jgi:hypothetical protein
MTESSPEDDSPELSEGEFNGRTFSLGAPQTSSLPHDELVELLQGRNIEIENERDDDDEKLFVPDVFKKNGDRPSEIATVTDAQPFETFHADGVIGSLTHNKSNKVTFDGKKILTFDTVETEFMIFKTNGIYYLTVFGKRGAIKSLSEFLSEELTQLGFTFDEITISHRGFERIRDDLVDHLRLTTFSDYSSPNIHKKRWIGSGYGDNPDFEQEKTEANIRGHRFSTAKITDDVEQKTIEVSEDCLVRSYNTIELYQYIDALSEYILPNINTAVQSSAYSYGSNGLMPEGNED